MQEIVSVQAEAASLKPGASAPTEVKARRSRRRFSAEYKLKVLAEIEGCEQGRIGVVLRREGLYWSNIEAWRRQQKYGLSSKKRGRKPDENKALKDELAKLQRKSARLEKQLRQAECIIEIQKKVSSMLGLPPIEDEIS